MTDLETADIKEFEAALKLMNARKYKEAAEAFQALCKRKDAPAPLVQAAVIRHHSCQVRLNPPTLSPKGFQECVDAATFCLNAGDLDRAAAFLAQARKHKGHNGLVAYVEAALHCRQGDTAKALEALAQAIAADPGVKTTVRHDPDFEPLHGLEGFRKLL
jgi:tetratricopeptide (TPR) repeat protein